MDQTQVYCRACRLRRRCAVSLLLPPRTPRVIIAAPSSNAFLRHSGSADSSIYSVDPLYSHRCEPITDILGLFSNNVGSFSFNVSRKTSLFSINLGQKERRFRVRAFMLSSHYT
jgi:hypothetical protein